MGGPCYIGLAAVLPWKRQGEKASGLASMGDRPCYMGRPVLLHPPAAAKPGAATNILTLHRPSVPPSLLTRRARCRWCYCGLRGGAASCVQRCYNRKAAMLLSTVRVATMVVRHCYRRRAPFATMGVRRQYRRPTTLLPMTGGDATGVAAADGRRCYRRCCRRWVVMLPALLPTTGGDATGVAADDWR
jgi:hypothetical protein